MFANGNQVAWAASIAGSKAKYVAIFNIGDAGEEEIRISWASLGLPADCMLRDLWANKDLGAIQEWRSFRLAPHASAFYKVTPTAY